MNGSVDFDGLTTIAPIFADEGSLLEPQGVVGRGVARCRPDDVYDKEIGQRIALGRAIADFGQQVTELAVSESVSQADAIDDAFCEGYSLGGQMGVVLSANAMETYFEEQRRRPLHKRVIDAIRNSQ